MAQLYQIAVPVTQAQFADLVSDPMRVSGIPLGTMYLLVDSSAPEIYQKAQFGGASGSLVRLNAATAAPFSYTQSVPAEVWTIAHNLGRIPAVTVTGSGGSPVIGDVQNLNLNVVRISFKLAISGIAILV